MHLIHMTLLLASGLLLFQIKTSHYFVFSYPTCLAHDIFPAWQGEAVLPFLLEPNQEGQSNARAPLCALGLPTCWSRGGVSASWGVLIPSCPQNSKNLLGKVQFRLLKLIFFSKGWGRGFNGYEGLPQLASQLYR